MTHDRFEIYRLLDAEPRGLIVKKLEIKLWGNEIWLDLEYYDEPPKQFQIIFKECAGLQWTVIDDRVDERDMFADVIGLTFGEEGNHRIAVLHTDIFEVVVNYGNMTIVKDW